MMQKLPTQWRTILAVWTLLGFIAALVSAHATATPLPEHATLHYRVKYGALPAGRAILNWRAHADTYQLDLQLLPVIGGELRYQSHGQLRADGLHPSHYTAHRRGTLREQARFDSASKTLHFGAKLQDQAALQAHAQDVLSIAFQLAAQQAIPPKHTLQITNGRKVYQYRVEHVDTPTVHINNRSLKTIHLRSQNGKKRTEFWFAPDYHFLPVRIQQHDERNTIDQELQSLTINHTPQLGTPSP